MTLSITGLRYCKIKQLKIDTIIIEAWELADFFSVRSNCSISGLQFWLSPAVFMWLSLKTYHETLTPRIVVFSQA